MKLYKLNSNDIKKQKDMTLFIDLIYDNFIELTKYKKLLHTKEKIKENLFDDNCVVLIVMDNNNKIISYLVGNIMTLDDARKVLFISYIYVSETHRNKGLGSLLLENAEKIARLNKSIGIMLIYDSYDKNLVRFYETRGFMLDINLRRYERHDVFYKIL